MEINGSTISKNSAFYTGGIGNYDGDATITNSTISGNKAKFKTIKVKYGPDTYTRFLGGITGGVQNSGNLTITNSTISGNTAKGKAVKVKFVGYIGGHTHTNFYGGRGGGITNGYNSSLTLSNGMVTKNSATFFGGGLFNDHGVYTYTPGTITGNKAKNGPDFYDVP